MTIQKDPEGTEMKYLGQFADFKDKRVLEIGCGEGRMTWKYAPSTKQVMGVDLDTNALRVASVDRPYQLDHKVFFSSADSEHLPFQKETFDIAVLAWSL